MPIDTINLLSGGAGRTEAQEEKMKNDWTQIEKSFSLVGAMLYGFKNNRKKRGTLLCPFCGCENVHGGTPGYAESDNYAQWAGRGALTNIPFGCENGCSFSLNFGFHKGETFVFIEKHVVEGDEVSASN